MNTPVVRLIFGYGNGQVELISQQMVNMAIPSVQLAQRDLGFHIESRSVSNKTLASVPAGNVFSDSVEVFSPDAPISRVSVDQPSGAFTVVVPIPPTADHVTLVRLAASTLRSGGTAVLQSVDVASFPLSVAP